MDMDGQNPGDWSGISLALSLNGAVVAIFDEAGGSCTNLPLERFSVAAARLHSFMPAIALAKSVLFSGDGRIIAVGGDRGNYTVLYRNCGMNWVQIGQTFRLDLIGSVISEQYNVIVAIVCTNRNDFHIPRKRH